jgi:hypothetical protein
MELGHRLSASITRQQAMVQLFGPSEDGNKELYPNAEVHLHLLPGTACKHLRHGRLAAVGLDTFIVLLPVPHGQSERREITSAVGLRCR